MDSLFVNVIHSALPNLPMIWVNMASTVLVMLCGAILTGTAFGLWLRKNWGTIAAIFTFIQHQIEVQEKVGAYVENDTKKQNVIGAWQNAVVSPAYPQITPKADKIVKMAGGIGRLIEIILPFVKLVSPLWKK